MANHESDYHAAVAAGDTEKAVKAYDAYKASMEASGQKPKDVRDL